MLSTIYFIKNTVNGKIYIGSTFFRPNRRFNQHRSLLRRRLHPNSYLQRAWNRHTELNFVFGVLEEVPPVEKLSREQFWMDKTKAFSRSKGYNLSVKAAHHHTGIKHSVLTRQRISLKLKGRHWIGKPLTQEHKDNLSKSLKGRHFQTEVSKRKISQAAQRPRSTAWKESISRSQKGKPRWTQKDRQRISQQLTGRKQSSKTKSKRSASLKKLFSTPDYKAKRSEWTKRAWKTRKSTVKTTSST